MPIVSLLCLASCEGKINLFDQNFGLVYEKEGHYWLNNGQKVGFQGHMFDKLVPAYEETKTFRTDYIVHYYDYVCRCGYRMSYDRLSFSQTEDGMAITGYQKMTTGYDINGHIVTQERTIDRLYDIPSIYAGEEIICIAKNAFYEEQDKTASLPKSPAVIPSTIKTVKTHGFYQMGMQLTEKQFFPNLVTIESYGFEESSFKEITIGENLQSIGYGAFSSSKSLNSISLDQAQIEDIPEMCFSDCIWLSDVSLPENIQSIGSNAFYGCSQLKNLVLPASLKSLNFLSFPRNEKYETTTLEHLFFKGKKTDLDLDGRLDNVVYFYSEETPTEEGRYWHYVDGEPTVY